MPANGRWDLIRRLKVKVHFEEVLNTSCTKYSGICTVISYKTRQFLLFVEDQIIFSKD
jgi:hypothetical protein